MPEIWEDQEDDTQLVRDLRNQLKTSNKRATEAEARSAAAEGKLTEHSLTAILSAKGVNPKAARFIVKDGVDASSEAAVTEWLEENSDLFPAQAPAEANTPEPEAQAVDDETIQGYRQMAGTNMLQRPADISRFDEVNRTLPADATPEQIDAAFRAAGI